MTISRRDLLKGAAGLALAPLVPRAAAAVARAPFLVVVNCNGGNDGLNTVVPTHLAPYHDRRPTLALASSGLLDLDGRHMLHGALSRLQGFWREGALHVVGKVGYPNPNLSHFTSCDIYSNGVRDPLHDDGRGWLGRFSDAYCADPLGVMAVGLGRVRDIEATRITPLSIGEIADFTIQPDPASDQDHHKRLEALPKMLAAARGDALDVTLRDAVLSAHEMVATVRQRTAGWSSAVTWPGDTLGRSLRAVSQLLHGDLGTRIFLTGYTGFDTHASQLSRHAALLQSLDAGVGAFLQDMKDRGLWDRCALLVMSEFGRRNAENGSGGCDHGHGNSFLLIGGAVRGGRISGELSEADLLIDQPGMRYDFREVYSQLISRHLGLDPGPVFPESFTSTGELDLIL